MMKQKSTWSFGATLLVSMFLYASCKDDIDTQLPPPGPQGPQGVAGSAGSLDLIIRDVTVLANDWFHYQSTPNHLDSASMPVPELSAAVADSGMVIAYQRIGNAYYLMPHSGFNGLQEATYSGYYYTETFVFTFSANAIGGPHGGTAQFRLLLAKGSQRLAADPPDILPIDRAKALRILSGS